MFNGGTHFGGVATADYFRGYTTPDLVGYVRHAIIIDWDGDNRFKNTYSDISGDVFGQVETLRGRDYASQLTGRSVSGSFQALVRNYDGKYSSFNASSPLYGKLVPKRKIQVWAAAPEAGVLWTGQIDTIEPHAVTGSPNGEPFAVIKGSGVFKQIGDQANRAYPAAQISVQTGTVIGALLDAINWPSAARSIEDGEVPIGQWFTGINGVVALQGIQEMEDAEQGFAYEGLNHDVRFEGRYHRQLYRGTSQAAFDDDPASAYPYVALNQLDSIREIYNDVSAQVTPYSAVPIADVWTLSGSTPYLAPGASQTFQAVYADGFIYPWTTPVAGTDVVASGGTISITLVSSSSAQMTFTVTNSHVSQGATLTTVKARGIAYAPSTPFKVLASDSTSQSTYGKRSYPLGSPWYGNAAYAQAACDWFIRIKKDPHPVLELTIAGGTYQPLASRAVNLTLSDRVTVTASRLLTKLGISASDFFIESIRHQFGPGIPWLTTFTLSPAGVQEAFWILGDATYGVLDSTTKVAY